MAFRNPRAAPLRTGLRIATFRCECPESAEDEDACVTASLRFEAYML